MPIIDLDFQSLGTSYDVCVIGAGAAGITTALELSAGGMNVLLCEGGGREFSANSQDAYKGDTSGAPYYPLDTARMRFLGGSTNHWAGYCHPLQESDFVPRNDLPVPGWPISYDELQPHFARACEIATLPIDPWNFENISTLNQFPEVVSKDAGMFGSVFRWPTQTKFAEMYGAEFINRPNLTVAINANFVDVDFGIARNAIASAKLLNSTGGVNVAKAKLFVIACGGMENAKLLLNLVDNHAEFIDIAPRVGEFFMEHLCYYNSAMLVTGEKEIASLATLISPQKRDYGTFQFVALTTPEARAEHGISTNVSITLDDTRFYEPNEILAQPATKGVQSMLKYTGVSGSDSLAYLVLRAEQLPNPESNITLTNVRDAQGLKRILFNWGFDPRDKESMVRTVGLFAQNIASKGLGRVYMRPPDGATQWTTIYGGYHHMGTTRMSESVDTGVVDANCRVHGFDNLYIAGSSIFSTAGWANPTINIVAFSVRLAEHLKGVAI